MSVIDQLLENAERYGEAFDKGDLPLPPGKRVAIVACMDARLNPYGLLGLSEGDALAERLRLLDVVGREQHGQALAV